MTKIITEKQFIKTTYVNGLKSHLLLETIMERQAEILALLNKSTKESELAKSIEMTQAKHDKFFKEMGEINGI